MFASTRPQGALITFALCLAGALAGPTAPPASAAVVVASDVGYRDFAYGTGAGSGWVDPDLSPTASKPQSKLWFAQGIWWGVLNDPVSNDFRIHVLDTSTQQWSNTGVLVDARNGSRADALWDGSHLYIVSAPPTGTSASNGIQLTRYSFVGGVWAPDAGFPVTLSSGGVEAAVIAKDSTGALWVTYTQGSKVRVVVGQPGGLAWGAPFTPAVPGTTVSPDDISSVVAYDGQVSIVWSNQVDSSVYAATHVDAAAPTVWQGSRKVVSGPYEADDHINIASVEGNGSGRLFVAVKTSQDDAPNNSNAPLIRLLVLGNDDVWQQYVHSRVRDGLTRPIVLLDTTNQVLRVFATGPNTGGVVYMKATPLANISFAEGRGEPFIKLASDAHINNPTSTKQNLSAATGLVVLASDQVTGRYVHNTLSLGVPPPPPPPSAPTAAFSASPTSGAAPLPVSFTGSPTSWAWTFGDGGTSTATSPTHTYGVAGTYTVSLTVSNAGGSNTSTRTGLVTVGAAPPPPSAPTAAFSASPTSGAAPLPVSFTDSSTGSPTSWAWTFGDGGTSTATSPTHTYAAAGTYTVSLTASNASGSDTSTRTGMITVGSAPPPPPPPPPPGAYANSVATDTPVGYWRLGDTGTVVAAVVGPTGTASGGVTSTTGALTGDSDLARTFDGATGYVSVPSSPALNPTGDFSVEAWARADTVHSGVVVQKGGANGYSVWQYRLSMTSIGQWRGTVFVGSNAYAVTAPASAVLGRWTYLVLTRSGNTLSMYVNGVLVATAAGAGTLNTTTSILAVGRSGASTTSWFDGSIDEVAVYDHALQAARVAAHYTAGGGQ